MATRRSGPAQPRSANLSIDQMRVSVGRLQRRIDELEAFDPRSVQQRWAPEVKALETSIDESLASVFGHDTVEYNRYREAARLDRGPITVTPSWIAARSGGRGGFSHNLHDVHGYLAEGKQQAILLLQQAVRGLEEEIRDRGELDLASTETVASPKMEQSKVFLVHGHDDGPKAEIARFVEQLGFEALILHERPNMGRTLIAKFREESANTGFAVVLMTPDDVGRSETATELKARARQNVVFELGFFVGRLGPERVAAVVKGEIEKPSDFDGVVYISFDKEDWRTKLGMELQAAGYKIDWNKIMRR